MKQTRSPRQSSSLGEAPAPSSVLSDPSVSVFTIEDDATGYVTLAFRAWTLADPEPVIRRTFVAALREGIGQLIQEGRSVSTAVLSRLSVSVATGRSEGARAQILASLAEADLRPSRGFAA